MIRFDKLLIRLTIRPCSVIGGMGISKFSISSREIPGIMLFAFLQEKESLILENPEETAD